MNENKKIKEEKMIKDISGLANWDNIYEALEEAWKRGYEAHRKLT